MKNIAQKTLLSFIALGAIQSAFALDSGKQNLTNTVGATDYFKINCAGETDHLNFKLFEGDANIANAVIETPAVIPAQLFNATLTKLKLTTTVSAIEVGATKDIILKGGNGAYTLSLDTFGTNLAVKTAQTYSVQYQCLNTAGKVTTGSSTLTTQNVESKNKSLANSKTAKYVINCAKSKTTGNTSSLKVKIINKTPVAETVTKSSEAVIPSGNLTAQVIKGAMALNTTGDELNLQNGAGDYSMMVNSPINKAQNYHFQYSCKNTKNVETKTSPFQLLQDQ